MSNQTVHNSASPSHSEEPFRLFHVGPLHPDTSGVATYSEELLKLLAFRYEIITVDPIREGQKVHSRWPSASVAEFLKDIRPEDRVLYELGNSSAHHGTLQLMMQRPGTCILHDAYLSGLVAWETSGNEAQHTLEATILRQHGHWGARLLRSGVEVAAKRLPLSADAFSARGSVIVHSTHAAEILALHYPMAADRVVVLPQLRHAASGVKERGKHKAVARETLGVASNDIVIASFGHLGPNKQNIKLVQAVASLEADLKERLHLVFVGKNAEDAHGKKIIREVDIAKMHGLNVTVTGHVDDATYESFLWAADVAVQLRIDSRGESSRAILDAFAFGLPVVANRHGSSMEFPQFIFRIVDAPGDAAAVARSVRDVILSTEAQAELAARASTYLQEQHNPAALCGAIQKVLDRDAREVSAYTQLLRQYAQLITTVGDSRLLHAVAQATARTFPSYQIRRRLLLDISGTLASLSRGRAVTGIERAALRLASELLSVRSEFDVRLVYLQASNSLSYRYVGHDLSDELGIDLLGSIDAPCVFQSCDTVVLLDYSGQALKEAVANSFYDSLLMLHGKLLALIQDVLPLTAEEMFPPDARDGFREWFDSVASVGDFIATTLHEIDNVNNALRLAPQREAHWSIVHGPIGLGSDFIAEPPEREHLRQAQTQGGGRPLKFLMVGSIEPQKGYVEALDAFVDLWDAGWDFSLEIVGRVSAGWREADLQSARRVRRIEERILSVQRRYRQFYWRDDASDQDLARLYRTSDWLICASNGEGYGLPLVEAGAFGVNLMVRELGVFRELLGDLAVFFTNKESLSHAIEAALRGQVGGFAHRVPQTWRQTADLLLDIVRRESRVPTSERRHVVPRGLGSQYFNGFS